MHDTAIIKIADYTRSELQQLWLKLFHKPFPKGLSSTIARPILAWELQARTFGGLDREAQAALRHARSPHSKAPKLQTGSQLLRVWNGITHKVEVTEDGFLWNGQNWRSLSAIARAITGAHWSGPRFFGLNTRKTNQKSKANKKDHAA